ncbi:MAG: 50S ribosomal protein L6 [Clostridiales bacterium]|nr:50S ribosomal protein L6 [Clostridiales bacterium]
MSRIGKKVIVVPAGVTVDVDATGLLTVKGPKGSLEYRLQDGITANVENNELTISRSSDVKEQRALHGLTRALVNNMVIGVTEGFTKQLEIVGVGYRAEKKGNTLHMNLGYSHPIVLDEPAGITFDVPNQTTVIVKGIDKELVGRIAAKIRAFRKPNPYADSPAQAKGVRYHGERILVKEGKKSTK